MAVYQHFHLYLLHNIVLIFWDNTEQHLDAFTNTPPFCEGLFSRNQCACLNIKQMKSSQVQSIAVYLRAATNNQTKLCKPEYYGFTLCPQRLTDSESRYWNATAIYTKHSRWRHLINGYPCLLYNRREYGTCITYYQYALRSKFRRNTTCQKSFFSRLFVNYDVIDEIIDTFVVDREKLN